MDERTGNIEKRKTKQEKKQGEKNLTEVLHKARGKYLGEVIKDSANSTNSGNILDL